MSQSNDAVIWTIKWIQFHWTTWLWDLPVSAAKEHNTKSFEFRWLIADIIELHVSVKFKMADLLHHTLLKKWQLGCQQHQFVWATQISLFVASVLMMPNLTAERFMQQNRIWKCRQKIKLTNITMLSPLLLLSRKVKTLSHKFTLVNENRSLCMYVYVCTCVYVCMYVCIYVCMCVYVFFLYIYLLTACSTTVQQ